VITAKEAVSLTAAQDGWCIIGGGVIGMELGMVYQKLGSKVIVVELSRSAARHDRPRSREGGRPSTFTKAGGEVLLKPRRRRSSERRRLAKVVDVGPDGKTRRDHGGRVLWRSASSRTRRASASRRSA
jgi:dihydrolipoamide dehydrogenase